MSDPALDEIRQVVQTFSKPMACRGWISKTFNACSPTAVGVPWSGMVRRKARAEL